MCNKTNQPRKMEHIDGGIAERDPGNAIVQSRERRHLSHELRRQRRTVAGAPFA